MKTVKFDCHGHNAPAYGCNLPCDQSGEYLRVNQGQRQDSLRDQLNDLAIVADMIGCYDAADFIRHR